MYAVVNHMKLSRPLDDNIIGRMNSELMTNISQMPGVANADFHAGGSGQPLRRAGNGSDVR